MSPSTDLSSGWLTIRQASERFGVSTDALRRAIRSNRLPASYQRGDGDRAWLISLADLLEAGFEPEPTMASTVDDTSRQSPTGSARQGVPAASMHVRLVLDDNTELRRENTHLRELNLELWSRLTADHAGVDPREGGAVL